MVENAAGSGSKRSSKRSRVRLGERLKAFGAWLGRLASDIRPRWKGFPPNFRRSLLISLAIALAIEGLLPPILETVSATGPTDAVGHTLEAAWLASVEEGRFLFEAYQQVAALADSHRPADQLRDAFEHGRRPPPPPSKAEEATSWIGARALAFSRRPPVARSLSGNGAAHAALSLVREVGTGRTMKASAAPPETTRGGTDWASVYSAAAPSVVFIALQAGYGSGFVLGSRDWLLTNHHVAAGGGLSAERHWQVNVYFGTLSPRGVVKPVEVPVPATVYKWDTGLDLALLKIEWGSESATTVRPLSLAKGNVPLPGQEVAAIGNAGLGLLWSMKPGHVAAIGTISQSHPDLLSLVDGKWRASQGSVDSAMEGMPSFDEMARNLKAAFEDLIGAETLLIQATAPISPGDSGGPLLDENGEVVGISSWGQGDPLHATSTNYFVHGSEIASFVAAKPDTPLLELVRDLWPSSVLEYQLDGLAEPDDMNILSGLTMFGDLNLLALDLDGAHGLDRFAEGLAAAESSTATLETVIDERAFDAEFGLVYDQRLGTSYALYDLDNDGRFEVIRIAEDLFSPLDGEYHAFGDTYLRHDSPDADSLMLPVERLPEGWRDTYELFLEEFSN